MARSHALMTVCLHHVRCYHGGPIVGHATVNTQGRARGRVKPSTDVLDIRMKNIRWTNAGHAFVDRNSSMTGRQGVLGKGEQYQSGQHGIIPQTAYNRTGRADSGQMKHVVFRLLSRKAAVHAVKEHNSSRIPIPRKSAVKAERRLLGDNESKLFSLWNWPTQISSA